CGVKGTGKTKTLIDMVNTALETSRGSVVCIEKGTKLIHEIKYQARLIDTEEYKVSGSVDALYGFVAGIYASNHDVTHIFVDSALKIIGGNIEEFEQLTEKFAEFGDKNGLEFVVTSSIPLDDVPENLKKYL
ncbi:MAG: hypothetical protein WCQ72_08525, partial [Eubacteriales bacterium]